MSDDYGITQYDIVEAETPRELEEKINKYLSEGWRLQGGVSVVVVPGDERNASDYTYSQAMVR